MRILHVSHEGLPDWRIEKSAISVSKLGHEVIFAGRKNNPIDYNRKIFSKIYEINWTAKARLGIPFYWHSVKKQVEKVINELRPDIVLAHNIFSAKMISEFGLPFVYDDHEYWSRSSKLLTEMSGKLSFRRKGKENPAQYIAADISKHVRTVLINRYAKHIWTKWEKELVSTTPTITVSDKIAEDLRVIGNNTNRVFVVPNFPMKFEVKGFEKPYFHSRLSSVYAGSDEHFKQKYPNRNINGFSDLFSNRDIGCLTIIGWEAKSSSSKVNYTGFISRQSMFDEMSNHSIGLIPFKKHWFHIFTNPNKAYEYAHVGLFVICTSSLKSISETLKGNCATFEDYNDLASQLEYFKKNLDYLYKKRLKIFEFARNNLIWENYEKNIIHSYQLC